MTRSTRALIRVFIVGILLSVTSLLVSSRTYAQESADSSTPATPPPRKSSRSFRIRSRH